MRFMPAAKEMQAEFAVFFSQLNGYQNYAGRNRITHLNY